MRTTIKARYFSTSCAKYQESQKVPQENKANEEYFPIYKFSYIRGIALINRLKLFHTVSSAIIVPSTLACFALDLTDLHGLQIVCYLSELFKQRKPSYFIVNL